MHKKLNRVDKLMHLYMIQQAIITASTAMDVLSRQMAFQLREDPLDHDAGRLLDLLERLMAHMNVPELSKLMSMEVRHEVMRPHGRDEVISDIFNENTRTPSNDTDPGTTNRD